MTTFKSTHHIARKIVIKLGGSTLEQLNAEFFQNFKALQQQGYSVIITHGGGPAINRALAKAQIESQIIDGLRVTSEEMIHLVQGALVGEVNPYLVQQLNAAGIPAVGLNGFDHQLLQCEYLNKDLYQYVGEIKQVNTHILDVLTAAGIVPVVACLGTSFDGQALNINGDTVASQVALAVEAESLLLVTDVAGIRIEGEYQTEATEAIIEQWIEEEHIYGGMIPKVRGALACLHAGIPSVRIVNDTLTGTTILSEELVK